MRKIVFRIPDNHQQHIREILLKYNTSRNWKKAVWDSQEDES